MATATVHPVETEETERRPRQVHTITDRYSVANTFLLDDGKLIVVDPGSDTSVRLLLTYIQRFLKRSVSDIDLIVLTHLHEPHLAGLSLLRRYCQAPVAASAIIRTLAQEERGSIFPYFSHMAEKLLSHAAPHVDLLPPSYSAHLHWVELWLDDVSGLPEHPDWRVIASPGHTPESICLYNPFTLELLCGDTISTVEGHGPLLHVGANRQRLYETFQVLRELPVRYLYPGHGRPILAMHPLQHTEIQW
ncbi:glyoxylase-like metal-dependent hydrolase (beta-lactamase superfamily II) [Thermosporothrix hazakensis]|jgi:glyoxylase-like metal-dependent hydrolase (beta-lactamase superfamily II)|uniref:Glyoxylase-like metal-dependent hydrolase (Beta-lactamase superfamily II) n=2 Tax=Thermosporothrix TaxID=768650 RepID=A0A326U4K0_THEHA|nr:MBL fold metallo-hydrolase [Thermosporothrix hazakensis]PZW26711.1 glyoxylase-like metal-dependent hydrolase (beta-lactamase superfamily II) [Thermosporothrix hazakensis]BBH89407.1 putative metallo-beta-lactamase superfamily protein [Thermosporothrix sp. COM3]GCE47590.1 putative metallo-beta-lactamase superfamily protein [Thermosporothrix hazakensis]